MSVRHLELLTEADASLWNGKSVQRRAAGVFYTHDVIGRALARTAVGAAHVGPEVSVIDPFGGDGRLVAWTIEELAKEGVRRVKAATWELDPDASGQSADLIRGTADRVGVELDLEVWAGDSFARATQEPQRWDIVITNPPWELIKPDRRELSKLPDELHSEYIGALRDFDKRLATDYPLSQPSRKFAGWGTNLSRVGTEIAFRLAGDRGVVAAVCPTSLLADGTSAELREWVLRSGALAEIAYYPAEARLFHGVDVPCCTLVSVKGRDRGPTRLIRIGRDREVEDVSSVRLSMKWLEGRGYSVPVELGAGGIKSLRLFDQLPRFGDLEGPGGEQLWAGRELDETGRARFTRVAGERQFVRSAHIARLRPPALPEDEFVDEGERTIPPSSDFYRLAWRDISRPSQVRRVHATILEPGPVAGNSVGIAHFRDGSQDRTLALLALVSSLAFEFQVRSLLMTNHVSLGVMRATRVPNLGDPKLVEALARGSARVLRSESLEDEAELERLSAEAFGLNRAEWAAIADRFELSDRVRSAYEEAW